jgi:hypothetical protein
MWKILSSTSALAISAVLTITTTSSVRADVFGGGPPDSGYYADNSLHMYCMDLNYFPAWDTPMVDSLNYLQSQTNLTVQKSLTCSNDTDALFVVRNGPELTGIRGSTQCLKMTKIQGICAGSLITLNSDILTDYVSRRKTSCHELGHTVGLTHSWTSDDCMISGASSNVLLNLHHANHINNYYAGK